MFFVTILDGGSWVEKKIFFFETVQFWRALKDFAVWIRCGNTSFRTLLQRTSLDHLPWKIIFMMILWWQKTILLILGITLQHQICSKVRSGISYSLSIHHILIVFSCKKFKHRSRNFYLSCQSAHQTLQFEKIVTFIYPKPDSDRTGQNDTKSCIYGIKCMILFKLPLKYHSTSKQSGNLTWKSFAVLDTSVPVTRALKNSRKSFSYRINSWNDQKCG